MTQQTCAIDQSTCVKTGGCVIFASGCTQCPLDKAKGTNFVASLDHTKCWSDRDDGQCKVNGGNVKYTFDDQYGKHYQCECPQNSIISGSENNAQCLCNTGYKRIKDESGNNVCQKTCTDNEVQEGLGCICKAGYYRSQENCVQCEDGTYKSNNGDEVCKPCPTDGSTVLSPDRTACTCVAGYEGQDGACTKCKPGTYQTVSQDDQSRHLCQVCPDGTRSAEGATTCTRCGEGLTSNYDKTDCVALPTQQSASGLPTGAVIGIVIGVLVIIAVAVTVAVVIKRRKNKLVTKTVGMRQRNVESNETKKGLGAGSARKAFVTVQ